MEDRIEELLAPAFRVVPAEQANVAIARARRERAGGEPEDDEAPTVRSYEIILGSWRQFADEQLAKLVYHLESVGAHLPACAGVIISAFAGDRLYLMDARDFMARVVRLTGSSAEELSRRYGTGEERAVPRAPVLLPPPRGNN